MTRSDLRLVDLRKGRGRSSKLMNVKVPTVVAEAIARVANELGCSKTEAFIALVNEGLDAAAEQLKNWTPPRRPKEVVSKPCRICGRQVVAKGLCATHYQAMRRCGDESIKRSA